MTPAEHYAEAERLLAGAQNVMDVAPIDGLTRDECASLALTHAILSLRPTPAPMEVPEGWPASADAQRVLDETLAGECAFDDAMLLDADGVNRWARPLVEPAPVVDKALRGDGAA